MDVPSNHRYLRFAFSSGVRGNNNGIRVNDITFKCMQPQSGMSARLAALMSQAGDDAPLSVDEPQPFTRDLSEVKRNPDRWQPRWIREKYFGSR